MPVPRQLDLFGVWRYLLRGVVMIDPPRASTPVDRRTWPGWPALIRTLTLFVAVAWLAPSWFFFALIAEGCFWIAWHRAHDAAGLHMAPPRDWVAASLLYIVIFGCVALVADPVSRQRMLGIANVVFTGIVAVLSIAELAWRRRRANVER